MIFASSEASRRLISLKSISLVSKSTAWSVRHSGSIFADDRLSTRFVHSTFHTSSNQTSFSMTTSQRLTAIARRAALSSQGSQGSPSVAATARGLGALSASLHTTPSCCIPASRSRIALRANKETINSASTASSPILCLLARLPSAAHRTFATNPPRLNEASIPAGKGTPIGQIDRRLSLTFTCSVDDCGHRSTHEFAKRSYDKGIVLVQCPSCKNRHLIADNLGWFTEKPDEPKNIEDIVRAKGGRVRSGRAFLDDENQVVTEMTEGALDQGETLEIFTDSDDAAMNKA